MDNNWGDKMKQQPPVRLAKIEEPKPLSTTILFLHPAAFVIAGLITIMLIGALMFALNGGCAVESGVGRNFIANGC